MSLCMNSTESTKQKATLSKRQLEQITSPMKSQIRQSDFRGFKWNPSAEEVHAYVQLISALAEHA